MTVADDTFSNASRSALLRTSGTIWSRTGLVPALIDEQQPSVTTATGVNWSTPPTNGGGNAGHDRSVLRQPRCHGLGELGHGLKRQLPSRTVSTAGTTGGNTPELALRQRDLPLRQSLGLGRGRRRDRVRVHGGRRDRARGTVCGDSTTPIYVFNNVYNPSDNAPGDAEIFPTCCGGGHIWNNTLIAPSNATNRLFDAGLGTLGMRDNLLRRCEHAGRRGDAVKLLPVPEYEAFMRTGAAMPSSAKLGHPQGIA